MFFNVIKSLALGVIIPAVVFLLVILACVWLWIPFPVPFVEILHICALTIPLSLFLSGLGLFMFWAAASGGLTAQWFAALVGSVGLITEVVAGKLIFFHVGSWDDVALHAVWGLLCCLSACGYFHISGKAAGKDCGCS